MKPNIDRRGRIARAVSGTLCILLGVVLWPLGWPASIGWRGLMTALAVGFGLFQWYEAKKSWCVMRACGVKTPM